MIVILTNTHIFTLTKKNTCPQIVTKFDTPVTVCSLTHKLITNIAISMVIGPAQNLKKTNIITVELEMRYYL